MKETVEIFQYSLEFSITLYPPPPPPPLHPRDTLSNLFFFFENIEWKKIYDVLSNPPPRSIQNFNPFTFAIELFLGEEI